MVSKPLNLKYVYKRQRYLEKRNSIAESSNYDINYLSDDSNKSLYKWRLENFFNSCTDYKSAISVLESLYEKDDYELLEKYCQVVINDIIPLVENANLGDCLDTIRSSNIGDINIDRLVETTKMYKRIDRIIKNHKNLSKKFKLESFSNKAKSDKEKIFSICEKVDTYTLSPFVKMNIVLEEVSYLCYSEGIEIPVENIVENVTNYFLLRDSNTKEDINSYKRAIEESRVLPLASDKNISFLTESSNKNSSYWMDRINRWKLDSNKSIDSLIEIAKSNLNDIIALTEINNIINDFTKINNIDFDPKTIFENLESVSGSEAHNIINIIKENNIQDTDSLVENLTNIWEADINNDIYYADGNKERVSFTSNEIDPFKVNNLITDSQTAGDFLSTIEKTSAKESPLNIHRIKRDEDDINDDNIMNYIDANNHISTNIASYNYEGSIEEAYNFVNTTVNCLNNILYNRDSYAYYTLGENSFDINLRSKYDVIISENQKLNKGFTTYEKSLICNLNETTNLLENLIDTPILAIVDKLHDRKYAGTITAEEAGLIYEILSPYLESDDNIFTDFVELCKEEANPRYNYIKYICYNKDKEPFNIYEDHNLRLNFCAQVMGINEDAINRAKVNLKSAVNDLNPANKIKNSMKTPGAVDYNTDHNTKDIKKNNIKNNTESDQENKQYKQPEKKPLSLNDFKLAWTGVKSKLKNLSTKEKELSRDLDMEFNHLCKNIENGLSTDYREEIITGQVKRSLSKSIKILITWAGIGAIAGTATSAGASVGAATLAVLGPIVMWAKSAYTSRKEKMQILDEIDIELKVLDREIQRAESTGSTKKYRALLTVQKNLQRKRQEIYYGLARKGSKIPMEPVSGLRGRE